MSHKSNKSAFVVTTLASSLLLAGSAFAATPLAHGYMLGAQDAAAATTDKTVEGSCGAKADHEGKCGADKASHEGKCGEGKCGEGKCGMDKMDSDKDGRISQAEFAATHDGDSSKFAGHDINGDGFVDADEMDAHHAGKASQEGKCGEGKCGEGKCGAGKTDAPAAAATSDKAAMEGKCGEGKCGAAEAPTATPAADTDEAAPDADTDL